VSAAVHTPTRQLFDEEVAERVDDLADDGDWWCIRTDPWPCRAEGCDFVATHMTAAHRIVCWAEGDDLGMLRYAEHARAVGRNPRVERYREELGPAISFDQWVATGHLVHGPVAEDLRKPFPSF